MYLNMKQKSFAENVPSPYINTVIPNKDHRQFSDSHTLFNYKSLTKLSPTPVAPDKIRQFADLQLISHFKWFWRQYKLTIMADIFYTVHRLRPTNSTTFRRLDPHLSSAGTCGKGRSYFVRPVRNRWLQSIHHTCHTIPVRSAVRLCRVKNV
jgi:hypothetical protein